MKKIGVIVNTKREREDHLFDQLRSLASTHGLQLFMETAELAETLGATQLDIEKFGEGVDVVLALGGDGTMLYSARALHGSSVPILGVNLGSLGFLTSLSDKELETAILALVEEDYIEVRRSIALCTLVTAEGERFEACALNDVVLGWGASSRIVTLDVAVDGETVASFMCDGLIVSTPTGSTGHSLSAGGPIVHPGVQAFCINVICPHTLSSRPLVVPDSCEVQVTVKNAAKELILSIDGQDGYRVKSGDRILIHRSESEARFLQKDKHSYFDVLGKKLHWRGSSL